MAYEVKTRKDLIELLNNGTMKTKLGFATILLALGGTFVDAYDFGSISIGVIQLRAVLHLTSADVGLLTASMSFGALFGALAGGRIIDSVGRLKMFLLDLILFVIGAIGSALSIDLYMLIFFRVLIGIGVGIDFPVSLSLISEFSKLKSKGKNVNMWQSIWYIATVGIYAIAFAFYYDYAFFGLNIWRWVVGLGAIPALIIVLFRFKYMGESPLWTFLRGSKDDIIALLKRNDINDVILPETFESPILTHKSEFKQLFLKKYRKRTALSTALALEESMEYYAVGFYLPLILLSLYHGNTLLAVGATALLNIAGIIGGTAQSIITQKVGIRRLSMLGLSGAFLILLILGLYGDVLTIIVASFVLSLFVFFHSFGQGSQAMTMGVISYPTEIRGTSSGYTQAMIRVGSIIGFFMFPLLSALVGTFTAILYISIAPLLALIVVLFIKWDPIKEGDIDEKGVEDDINEGSIKSNA